MFTNYFSNQLPDKLINRFRKQRLLERLEAHFLDDIQVPDPILTSYVSNQLQPSQPSS